VSDTATSNKPKSALLAILITVFLDLLSFGLFIPDLQLRGEALAAKALNVPLDQAGSSQQIGFMVGLLIAGYSMCQLVSAPLLGRLSDRIGRRPILLGTTVLSLASYLVYANATEFWISLASRLLAGLAAANLGVAFAYVADVTGPQDRAKGLGMVGAALGMGFILGPVIGGLLIRIGNDSPLLLGYVGAALTLVNLAFIYFELPESVQPGQTKARAPFFEELRIAFSTRSLVLLLCMFFAFNFGFAMLQATFFRLLADSRSIFHLDTAHAKEYGSYILGMVGVSGAVIQGGLLPKFQRRFGEIRLLRFGMILLVPGLALVPYAPLWLPVLLVVVLQGIGSGLSQPSLSSLVSRNAPAQIQGGIFGVTQALGALARLIGPIIGNPLFAENPAYPFLFGACVLLFPTVAAWSVKAPETKDATSPEPAEA